MNLGNLSHFVACHTLLAEEYQNLLFFFNGLTFSQTSTFLKSMSLHYGGDGSQQLLFSL